VSDWMTTKQVAPICGVSRLWLFRHRNDGVGPPYHRRGRKVLYRRDEIEAWLNAQRVGAAR